ncbi:hydroxymethylbilane synthase [Chitinophaga sancti]|uniref:Hydroxymethylbilane synthase n=1 Tax=Chitinophaga sancti TaxID=1004 RepID=A0A1K1QLL6_9BACT|nr:hydroxymethylbilane synthase [Chitinophaga sancti]WQD65149.1 hydroxymethylbilane synthase [Chitinophaga sancti]WQG89227.1 hydroxymethylbilane synthase [Chitinophaga sancti]SFW60515.1 hydroxymethylbilane synthase [Chitinophaga sancti]
MSKEIKIGTRESQLALWQANKVKDLLEAQGYTAVLVPIKSEGDIDLVTPLYEIGVQGIFTKSLDIALLNGKIDIAVHSLKDVPTQLPTGIIQGAVLERGPVKDLLVYKTDTTFLEQPDYIANIATSSVRRKAQWLHKFPLHHLHNLRGNVNTRLQKLANENWDGAIFAAAGLERINVRPATSVELDWMLPAPAQGAVVSVCRENDDYCRQALEALNDIPTALCTRIERDFLRALMGGCTTPISAHATIKDGKVHFNGELCSLNGDKLLKTAAISPLETAAEIGNNAAKTILQNGGDEIVAQIKNAR